MVFENAKWIMCDFEGDIIDKAFLYKKSFVASKSEGARLYISAHTQYAVYINGEYVDGGQYDGYEDYQVYDTLDISAFIKDGENELSIWHYVCGDDFSTRKKLIPGVIFSIFDIDDNCLAVSVTDCLSAHDARVRGLGEKITIQLCFNLDFDATANIGEFKASVLAEKSKALYPRPIKKLITEETVSGKLVAQGIFSDTDSTAPKAIRMLNSEIKHTDIIANKNGALSWDIAEDCDGAYLLFDCDECAGLLDMSLTLPAGTLVLIGFGEHLDDGRVRTYVGGRSFSYSYIANAGKNHFFYPLCRLGLRYLSLHIYSRKGEIEYAGIRKQHYPLELNASGYGNELHERIYDVGCNTLELCMHEHYEDCPWREQSLYAMDGRVQILCGYYAFSEYKFPAASLSLMARSLREDSLLELCPPGKVAVDIPSFTAVYVREVLEYTEYASDLSLAKEVFTVLERIVKGFASRIAENGLVPLYKGGEYWNFYEWRDGLDDMGEQKYSGDFDSPLNAFVYDAFKCFAKICKLLGHEAEAENYIAKAEGLADAVNAVFWDESYGCYRTIAEAQPQHILTQGLMLYTGIAPEEKRRSVAECIKKNELIPCSLSMSIYVYEALLAFDEAYKPYVLSEIERIWGMMLERGCQTFWETDLGADDFEKAGSLCHGWSAVPIYLFSKYYYNDK